jgi:hypothetical protein
MSQLQCLLLREAMLITLLKTSLSQTSFRPQSAGFTSLFNEGSKIQIPSDPLPSMPTLRYQGLHQNPWHKPYCIREEEMLKACHHEKEEARAGK